MSKISDVSITLKHLLGRKLIMIMINIQRLTLGHFIILPTLLIASIASQVWCHMNI